MNIDTPKQYTAEDLTVGGQVFGNITRANQARQALARKTERDAAAAATPAPKKARKGTHPAIVGVSSTDHKTTEVHVVPATAKVRMSKAAQAELAARGGGPVTTADEAPSTTPPKTTPHRIHEVPGRTTPVPEPTAPAPKPSKVAKAASKAAAKNLREDKEKAAAVPGDKPTTSPGTAGESKGDTVLRLLAREEGATLAQLQEATGWQAHSVRGYLAGTLKKKGHSTTNEKTDAGRVYKLVSAKAPSDEVIG